MKERERKIERKREKERERERNIERGREREWVQISAPLNLSEVKKTTERPKVIIGGKELGVVKNDTKGKDYICTFQHILIIYRNFKQTLTVVTGHLFEKERDPLE